MATHSSVLAWRIPGTGEPGGLPSMGSHRVGHDWSDLAAAAADLCKIMHVLLKNVCVKLLTNEWHCIYFSGKDTVFQYNEKELRIYSVRSMDKSSDVAW